MKLHKLVLLGLAILAASVVAGNVMLAILRHICHRPWLLLVLGVIWYRVCLRLRPSNKPKSEVHVKQPQMKKPVPLAVRFLSALDERLKRAASKD